VSDLARSTLLGQGVGIIGLGRIGAQIARRLARRSVPLSLFDVDPSRRALSTELAVPFLDDASEVARHSATILLSLPDANAVSDAVAGERGILQATNSRRVSYILDLSTISVAAGVHLANTCAMAGMTYLDAPISGGVWGASEGTLTVMIGGAPHDVYRVKPLLRMIASHVVHMGPTGSGQKAKLLHNMVGEIQVHAWAEAIVAATRLGLDASVFFEAMSTGMAASQVLTLLYGECLRKGRKNITVPIQTALKDQGYLRELADSVGLRLESPTGVWSRLAQLVDAGFASADVTSVLSYFEKLHGVTIHEP